MFYVYLDTSFLSQLAKAGRGVSEDSFDIERWINLLTLLRCGVDNDMLLCPASQFQTEEATLAEGLLKKFVLLQRKLSKSYYFKRWQDILVHQTVNQVLLYLKRPCDIDLGWKPFTKIPPPVRDPLTIAITKSNMVEYAKFAKPLREKFSCNASYSEHYKAEKAAFLGQTFFNPNSDWYKMLISDAKVREQEVPMLLSFLDPESVDSVPFINIFCSLWASIIVHERTRKYRQGDLLDIIALACAIPYCRIVTTDKNMKNIIGRLHHDKKYGISVYAPTASGLDTLAKALSDLSSR